MKGYNDLPLPEWPDPVDTAKLERFTCEFCGKGFWIDLEKHHLLHEVPHCTEFEAYDPLQYMRENNRRKAAKQVTA